MERQPRGRWGRWGVVAFWGPRLLREPLGRGCASFSTGPTPSHTCTSGTRTPGRPRPSGRSGRQQAGGGLVVSEGSARRPRWEGAQRTTHPWLSGCPKAKLVKDCCSPVVQRKESLAVL